MEMKNVYAAFVKAQKGFAPALKTSTNPHFKSKYADLSACVEAVLDSLNNNGIGLIQRTHQDETGVMVETLFVHESGESMSGGLLHVPASKQDAQGYGSALSYARRYSLMAACGIAPEDDDGNAASKPQAKPQGHQKGNERAATAATRVADEIIEAIRADLELRVVEKYQAACNDPDEDFVNQVWARLNKQEREYVSRVLDNAAKP